MAEYMDEELRHKIIACLYRNRDFCFAAAEYLKPSYFDESPVEKNIAKIGIDYWTKYKSVCSNYVFIQSLKALVESKFIKKEEIGIYGAFYKKIQDLDISDSVYIAETVISFIKKQEYRKAIEAAVTKFIPKNDFESLEKEFRKIAEMSALQEVLPYNYFGSDEIDARAERRHRSLTMVERGIKTGIKKMDDILPKGGFYRKELYNFMAPAKRGKCVTRDTIIHTSNGIGYIGDLIDDDHEPGEFVKKIVPILGYDGMDRTSHVYNSGYGRTKHIKLENGTFLEGTPHHPVLVYNDGEFYWKELQCLFIGDYIVGRSGDFVFGDNNKFLVEDVPVSDAIIPDKLTEELCSLIGLILPRTEWNSDMSGFVFEHDSEFILNSFSRLMKCVFGLNCPVSDGKVVVDNVSVCYFFSNIGINYNAGLRCIPDCIKKSNKNLYLAFFRAIVDCVFSVDMVGGSGKVNGYKYSGEFTSLMLVREVHASFNNVGVYSVIKKNLIEIPCPYSIKRYEIRVGFFDKEIGNNLPYDEESFFSKEVMPASHELMSDFFESIRINGDGKIAKYINPVERRLFDNYKDYGMKPSMKFIRTLVSRIRDDIKSHSYSIIKEIVENGYTFNRVVAIKNSMNETVDVTVPVTHSFIGNGVVNHNTTALSFFANMATLDGYNVAYFTCETSIEVLCDRVDAMNSDITIRSIDAKYKEARDAVRAVRPANGSLRFFEYPTKCLKCSDIENQIRKLQNHGIKIDMIIADYAGIMRPEVVYGESLREEASIYEGLRGLATKFDCPVLTASQINRSGTDKSIITGTDKAGSYEAIMVADYNISLSASADDLKRNQLTIHFAECRNVERRTLKINTSYETGRFFKKFIEEVE